MSPEQVTSMSHFRLPPKITIADFFLIGEICAIEQDDSTGGRVGVSRAEDNDYGLEPLSVVNTPLRIRIRKKEPP